MGCDCYCLGAFARCHSTLLLQISTTNSLESWHSALKHGVKQSMLTWSFCRTVRHIANIAHDYDKRAEKVAAAEWMSGQYSDSALCPSMDKLPGSLQRLVLHEREEAELLIQEGQDPKDSEQVACDCLFWQQYQLPCRHPFDRKFNSRGKLGRSTLCFRLDLSHARTSRMGSLQCCVI